MEEGKGGKKEGRKCWGAFAVRVLPNTLTWGEGTGGSFPINITRAGKRRESQVLIGDL